MASPIIVRYQTNPALLTDALRQLGRALGRMSLWFSLTIIWAAATFMGPYALSSSYLSRMDKPAQYLVSAALATIVTLLIWRLPLLRKSGNLGSPEEIYFRFSDMGVDKRTNATESKMEWGAFSGFLESKGFFFLCYPKLHSGAATLVEVAPKAAFQSQEELDRFRSLLTRKVQPEMNPKKSHRLSWIAWVMIGLLVLLFTTVKSMGWMQLKERITVAHYLQLKSQGQVWEVWINEKGTLTATLDQKNEANHGGNRKVVVEIPRAMLEDQELFNSLIQGIPESRVHDSRDD